MSNDEVKIFFDDLLEKHFHLKLVSLSTVDGFGVFQKSKLGDSVELDRVSAITSSLVSLSAAGSKQVVGGDFRSTTVETNEGFLLIRKIKMNNKEHVLAFVTGKDMLLGEANFIANSSVKKLINFN